MIQDFVKRKTGGKVDEYVFAQTLKELIDTQEQEIELAAVGKGEYQLREAFQHISVSPWRWGRMTELQPRMTELHMLWFSWQMASANVRIVQATALYHCAHMQLPVEDLA